MVSILIIDDNQTVRRLLRQVLEGVGYSVVDASNGREGLSRFRQDPTDLVITDILMPDKDGLETILELRREFPDVKIIAFTGETGQGNFLDVAKLLGANRTLTKPFDVVALRETVQDLLEIWPGHI